MSEMRNPADPGKIRREHLPEAMRVTDAANALHLTRQAPSALLNGRSAVCRER